jgi:hypothetical protein
MHRALQAMDGAQRFAIEVIDVDADEALLAEYDELVPVLVGHHPDGRSVRLCHYFLDQVRVRAFIDER